MGKVKTVIMGDEAAEEAARKARETKRTQKKLQRPIEAPETPQEPAPEPEKTKKPVSKKTTPNDKYRFNPGKKSLAARSLVDATKLYPLTEAIELAQKTSFSKFDGSLELHLNVTDKGLRGTVTLPHGTGKDVRVRIADEALITSLEKSGKIDFDILVASPDLMPKLARVAKILGPKGLMPNPKTGTISPDPEKLKEELSKGQLQWRTEAQTPIIHLVFGKVSFDASKLQENLTVLLKAIGRDKIRSAFVKATMGPSIKLQLAN